MDQSESKPTREHRACAVVLAILRRQLGLSAAAADGPKPWRNKGDCLEGLLQWEGHQEGRHQEQCLGQRQDRDHQWEDRRREGSRRIGWGRFLR